MGIEYGSAQRFMLCIVAPSTHMWKKRMKRGFACPPEWRFHPLSPRLAAIRT